MSLLQTPSPKRRIVRKGTFSCWECKHRKTRCEFKPSCSVCVSCQRRGLSCVSQEFDTESENAQVERRIIYVEGLVGQLAMQRNGSRASTQNETMQSLIPNPSPGYSVSSYLHSIFPAQAIATAILDDGKFSRLPMRMWDSREPLVQASERPQPSAHPVQFARKLILLALCLQQLNDPLHDAGRYIEIVSRHVTSQDMMVDSLDGLETLILEATYYINNDDLRIAWLKLRRALAIAQLIGLDRMQGGDRAKNTWLRLMAGDHFISLSLGLPAAVDISLVEPPNDSQQDLQRTHLAVSGRIIARNILMQQCHDLKYEETQDIDYLLKQATRSFPPSWWAFRSLDSVDEADVMEMTARLSAQIHQHYFVIILHQPYLMRDLCSFLSDEGFSYSKAAIPPSSREVLLRVIAHRNFHRGLSYHGVDEKAFTAATALLLAHIDGHRLGQANVLEHWRPQDLGIITEMMELIEDIVGTSAMVENLKTLMKIESEIANGANYLWTEGGDLGLELKIPYFGAFRAVLTSLHEVLQQDEPQTLLPGSLDNIASGPVNVMGSMPPIEQGGGVNMWDYVMETDI